VLSLLWCRYFLPVAGAELRWLQTLRSAFAGLRCGSSAVATRDAIATLPGNAPCLLEISQEDCLPHAYANTRLLAGAAAFGRRWTGLCLRILISFGFVTFLPSASLPPLFCRVWLAEHPLLFVDWALCDILVLVSCCDLRLPPAVCYLDTFPACPSCTCPPLLIWYLHALCPGVIPRVSYSSIPHLPACPSLAACWLPGLRYACCFCLLFCLPLKHYFPYFCWFFCAYSDVCLAYATAGLLLPAASRALAHAFTGTMRPSVCCVPLLPQSFHGHLRARVTGISCVACIVTHTSPAFTAPITGWHAVHRPLPSSLLYCSGLGLFYIFSVNLWCDSGPR